MADISVKFGDGTSHVYSDAPDNLSWSDAYSRAAKDFPDQQVRDVTGTKPATIGERLKMFATEGQKNIFTKDAPQLAAGLAGDIGADIGVRQPKTEDEKASRSAGMELPLAFGRGIPTKAKLTSALKPPAFRQPSWYDTAKKSNPSGLAKSIGQSPVLKHVATGLGFGSVYELAKYLSKYLP